MTNIGLTLKMKNYSTSKIPTSLKFATLSKGEIILIDKRKTFNETESIYG